MNTGKTLFAQIMDFLPCMAVSFDNAFRQRQHYRKACSARLLIATRLIDHSNPGLGASVDINGVIAGPVRRRGDQVRRPGEQCRVDLERRRDDLPRGANTRRRQRVRPMAIGKKPAG